jgi:hypothetical protein
MINKGFSNYFTIV